MTNENTNIKGYESLVSSNELKKNFSVDSDVAKFISNGRGEVIDIIEGRDDRKIIIVGPCSMHDYDLAIEYAKKLKILADKVKDKFLVVMRTYFEKPRSTVGWKGLISDPKLDGSNNFELGLETARRLLIDINKIGLLCGSEFLSTWVSQYLDDLISWVAIGARTTESQPHREMSSGLSVPVGFKNGTTGDIGIAINAVTSAMNPHSFLGLNPNGKASIINTNGNSYGHVILRGGNDAPNYDNENICKVCSRLEGVGLPAAVIIDCSHANSNKNYDRQPVVFREVMEQIIDKMECSDAIKGVMLESNLENGNQNLIEGEADKLKYGVSITDACISFETTEDIIMAEYERL